MILGLVLLTAASLIYFEFIQPAYEDAQSLKAQILGLESFLATQKTAVEKVKDLIAAYKGQGGAQSAVSAVLPEREDAAGALAQISGLAEESGLALQAVSVVTSIPSSQPRNDALAPQATSLITPVSTLMFQIKLAGSYENFKTLLSLLETNMRIFDVSSLAIQLTALGSGRFVQTVYLYDLSLATYYQGP